MSDAVCAYAPGSVSNLGPGFDCLGVAVAGCGDRVRVRRGGGAGARVTRVSDPRVPLDPGRNTAALAATELLRRAGRSEGLEIEVEKGLPLAGGLGGSAASAVAAVVAVQALLGTGFEPLELGAIALEAEAVVAGRHADNVAPSLLGGGVLVRSVAPLAVVRVPVAPGLAFVLATPDYGVETRRAREVLPGQVARSVAVAQAAHLGALLLGLGSGDAGLIRGALVDHIAEPARAPLYPGYAEARRAALEAGALGVVVSGAGPTLVALAPPTAAEVVARALGEGFREAGHTATTRVSAPDPRGARLE